MDNRKATLKRPSRQRQLKRRLRMESLEQRRLLAAEVVGYDLPSTSTNVDLILDASAGESIVFYHETDLYGGELWTTDGTAASTRLLKDIVPGPESPGIQQLVSSSDMVYFDVEDLEATTEIWQSDGTEEGTTVFAQFDIAQYDRVTISDASSTGLVVFADLGSERDLLFIPFDGSDHVVISDSIPQDSILRIELIADNHFLIAEYPESSTFENFWISDGTTEGTRQVTGLDYLHAEDVSFFAADKVVSADDGSFVVFSDDLDDLLRINPDGTGAVIDVPEAAGSITDIVSVSGEILADAARNFYRVNESSLDLWFPATLSNESYVASVVELNGDFIFNDYDPRIGSSTLFSYSPAEDSTTELSAALPYGEGDLYVAGGWVISLDNSNLKQLIAFNPTSGLSQLLAQFTNGFQDLGFVYSTEDRLFYEIRDRGAAELHLWQTSGETGAFESLSTLGAGNLEINSLANRGDFIGGFFRSTHSFQFSSIDLRTGQYQPLARLADDPYVVLYNELGPYREGFPVIGTEQFAYLSGRTNFVGITDTTPQGTRSQFASDAIFLPTTQNSIFFDSEGVGLVRAFTSESGPGLQEVPFFNYERISTTSDGHLIYLLGDDVLQMQFDAEAVSAVETVVSDYRSLTLSPISEEQLSDDPYKHRLVGDENSINPIPGLRPSTLIGDEWFGSDGTLERSGLIDTRQGLMERYALTSINTVITRGNAISASGSISGQRHWFVERPTDEGLQPFPSIDRIGFYQQPIKMENGWIIEESLDDRIVHWYWDDSQPNPVMIDVDDRPSLLFRKTPFFETPSDLLAFDPETQTVNSLRTLIGGTSSFYRDRIVGNDEGKVITYVETGEGEELTQNFYQWDGTADGLVRLDEVTRAFEETQDFPTLIVATPEYHLLDSRTTQFRVPRSQREVTLPGAATLGVFAGEGSLQLNGVEIERNVGELLSFDAIDKQVSLDVNKVSDIPINGLRFRVGSDANVFLSLPFAASDIRYEIRDGQVQVAVDGRTVWIEHEGELRLTDSGDPISPRTVVLELSNTHVELGQVGSNSATVRIKENEDASDLIATLAFRRTSNALNVVGRGSGQSIAFQESLISVPSVSIINASPTNDSFQTSFATPVGQTNGTVSSLGGTALTAQLGDVQIVLDNSLNPLQNPFNPLDTDHNGEVEPLDALRVINGLSRGSTVSTTGFFSPRYVW